ncbi:acetylornithine/succinyldiaminopimelate transaminase [Massilia sp. W12]|uniref:acetylornithine/succinyldiaminopimelate transaminase n=1 Tax=Massilia sp. W12 TaxID=3126507 RepID=UPI0030D032A0
MTTVSHASTPASALNAPVTRATFDEVIVPSYAPAQMVLVRGAGLDVWDQNGRQFLDFTSGIAVNSLGHAHPQLVAALTEQAGKLWHLSNAYTNEPVLRLGKALTDATFAERVFFCNSGAEANEAAFKLARKYAHKKSEGKKFRIIAALNSFHGRTLFTVSVGGQPKYTEGFAPLPGGIDHIPYNDLEAARAAIGDDVCAVVVEPVQGEGGVLPATKEYLQGLRDICNEKGALLIFDEVQTGVGRTGHLYAYQGYGVTPDILTTAKALGNGFPIGAMLTTAAIGAELNIGSHGTTYGGNPLAATVALNVLAIINQDSFLARVREAGEKMHAVLQSLIDAFPQVFSATRGAGLLRGLLMAPDFKGRSKDFQKACEANGLMILIAGPDVVRVAPALTVSDEQIAQASKIMHDTAAVFAQDKK